MFSNNSYLSHNTPFSHVSSRTHFQGMLYSCSQIHKILVMYKQTGSVVFTELHLVCSTMRMQLTPQTGRSKFNFNVATCYICENQVRSLYSDLYTPRMLSCMHRDVIGLVYHGISFHSWG